MGPRALCRPNGHQLQPDTDVLRFEVVDINRLAQRAAADAELYREIQVQQGMPREWEVLVLSCFAVTEEWPVGRLAEQTGFRQYRLVRATGLLSAGYVLWPTSTFVDDMPDPRNTVHYDLVVDAGEGIVPRAIFLGTPAERRVARASLVPKFQKALELFGEPLALDED